MVVSLILFALSLAGLVASVWVHGAVPSDPLLICLLSAAAAAILVFWERPQSQPRTGPRTQPNFIVVDGSNVMHWHNETPSIRTVQRVLDVLQQQGHEPIVWFDANVGYKIHDRYMGPYPLSRYLNIPSKQIFVAPKGTPADPLLLDHANRLGAKVVTNDRFRDWADAHPKVTESGFLVSGQVRGDVVALEVAT